MGRHVQTQFICFSSNFQVFETYLITSKNPEAIAIHWTQSPYIGRNSHVLDAIAIDFDHFFVLISYWRNFCSLEIHQICQIELSFFDNYHKQFVKQSVDNSLFYQFCELYDGFNLKYSLPDHFSHLCFCKQKIDRIITNSKTPETFKSNENKQSNKKQIKSK